MTLLSASCIGHDLTPSLSVSFLARVSLSLGVCVLNAGDQPSEESYPASLSARPTPTKEYPRCFGDLVGMASLAALPPPHSRKLLSLYQKPRDAWFSKRPFVRHRILAQGILTLTKSGSRYKFISARDVSLFLSLCLCTCIGWWGSKRQG